MSESKPTISTGKKEIKGIISKDEKTKYDIKITDEKATFDDTKLEKGKSKAIVKADITKYPKKDDGS
jgi:hypothetical protein